MPAALTQPVLAHTAHGQQAKTNVPAPSGSMFWSFIWGEHLGDGRPRGEFAHNAAKMDVFVTMFMFCAIEAVIVKIMMYDEQHQEMETSASRWFIGFDPD